MSNTETLGGWRGPSAIADDLRPGQPPQPSEGQEGPPLAEITITDWKRTLENIEKLGSALAQLGFDTVSAVASGNTDSSGNLLLGVYQVAAGVEARLHRLIVNANNPSTGVPYTPASTYANAAAYLLVGTADDVVNGVQISGLLDFAPPTAAGPIFPGLFTDNSQQAAFVRGPSWFVLQVNTGPASTSVYARYQISLRRMQGVV